MNTKRVITRREERDQKRLGKLRMLIESSLLFDPNLEAGDFFINTQPIEEGLEIPSDNKRSEVEPSFVGIEEDLSNNDNMALFSLNYLI
jgi:hypothetical protein